MDGKSQQITIKNTIKYDSNVEDVFFGLTIRKDDGQLVYWYTTEHESKFPKKVVKGELINVALVMDNIFGEGAYDVGVYLKSKDRTKEYVVSDNALQFKIVDRGENGWMLHPGVSIRIS